MTCPVGLEKGNRVDIRSPSGIMPVFSARVPTGKYGGDVFTVKAPSEEHLVQYEDKDPVGSLCGVRPYACGTHHDDKNEFAPTATATNHKETGKPTDGSWQNISYTLDAWLTPTPEIVGRPVEQQH